MGTNLKCQYFKQQICLFSLQKTNSYDSDITLVKFQKNVLESSNLNYRIKTYNGNGPVAHSAQVPPYSTQSLISTLGIMIVSLLVNLSTLAESFHITINLKDHVLVMYFHCHGTVMCFTNVCSTSNICFTSCPSMHACLPLLSEASTHFPWIQTMLSQPNLSIMVISSIGYLW